MLKKFLNFKSGISLIAMMAGSFLLVNQCGSKAILPMLLIITSLFFHIKYSLNDEFDRIVEEMKRESHQYLLKTCEDLRKELNEKYREIFIQPKTQNQILQEVLNKPYIEDG